MVFLESSRENSFIARLWATQRIGYLSAEKRRHGGSTEVDNEIRELGERYGIPTEFSSYLVVEPGMNPRRRIGYTSRIARQRMDRHPSHRLHAKSKGANLFCSLLQASGIVAGAARATGVG